MTMKKLLLPALIVTLALLAFTPPAAAIKSCAECTIYDPCNLMCYINVGGQTVYRVCDDFACSGSMMRTPLEQDLSCTSDLQETLELDTGTIID